jgi:hypothetical protein
VRLQHVSLVSPRLSFGNAIDQSFQGECEHSGEHEDQIVAQRCTQIRFIDKRQGTHDELATHVSPYWQGQQSNTELVERSAARGDSGNRGRRRSLDDFISSRHKLSFP